MRFMSCCLLVTAIAVLVNGDIPQDKIDGNNLPGWNKPLPSAHYSGYIEVKTFFNRKHLHYWFVESETNPETSPLVLWLNGGPGCSSLDGLFNEMGPIHFDFSGYSGGLPQLVYNPWTWNRVANMIFLESPAGVGFSYTKLPMIYNNDDITATENYDFLINWLSSFPEYKKNDFYIAGESYAGIYVPTLVDKIRKKNEHLRPDKQINLKGFAVGNGCIGTEVGACGNNGEAVRLHVEFYHGHGLYNDDLHKEITAHCKDYSAIWGRCHHLIKEMGKTIGNLNIYNIYDDCSTNNSSPYSRAINPLKQLFKDAIGPFDCIDDHVERAYFNDARVRKAIHVAPKSKIGEWNLCSGIRYHANTKNLLPIYPTLIKKYRTLIFNGDVDGCVPYNADEQWTSNLGIPVKKGWTAWMVNDQVAGYVTEYSENDFRFVTVKGAGHMVPQYKPELAFNMFTRFLLNQ